MQLCSIHAGVSMYLHWDTAPRNLTVRTILQVTKCVASLTSDVNLHLIRLIIWRHNFRGKDIKRQFYIWIQEENTRIYWIQEVQDTSIQIPGQIPKCYAKKIMNSYRCIRQDIATLFITQSSKYILPIYHL